MSISPVETHTTITTAMFEGPDRTKPTTHYGEILPVIMRSHDAGSDEKSQIDGVTIQFAGRSFTVVELQGLVDLAKYHVRAVNAFDGGHSR